MGYIEKTLLSDEVVAFRTKPHWVIYYKTLSFLTLSFFLLYILPKEYYFMAYIMFALTAYSVFAAFIFFYFSEYVVTNKRVLMKFGFIQRTSLEIFFRQIESMYVNQTILGRIFNFGTVIVVGSGGSQETFPFVPDPLNFKRIAQEQMDKKIDAFRVIS
jgi:uncharacterized membrane protein YdbT with pleckstrin-like domain